MENYKLTVEEVAIDEQDIVLTWKDEVACYAIAVCLYVGIFVVEYAVYSLVWHEVGYLIDKARSHYKKNQVIRSQS